MGRRQVYHEVRDGVELGDVERTGLDFVMPMLLDELCEVLFATADCNDKNIVFYEAFGEGEADACERWLLE